MIYRRSLFIVLAALGLATSTGCCCGPCGGDGCWYPGKSLFSACTCRGGCGPAYWGDYYNDPPDCCDPCDSCGHFAGGHAGTYGGGGCGCSGGGGMPMGSPDGGYEEGYMPGPSQGVPTPVARRTAPHRVRQVKYIPRPQAPVPAPAEEVVPEPSVTATSYSAPCTTCRR